MCALCGVLGGPPHWTEPAAGAAPAARRRERAARVASANRVLAQFAMRLDDWQGSAYMLSTATGKCELVETLGHLWAAAERLSGRPCDPLDPALLARLERA
jgi:hypothetical protein